MTEQAYPEAGPRRGAVAVRASAAATGVAAAALGLCVPAAVVLLLWIASPLADSGIGAALHVGAALWLLAQGADLVRTGTLSGVPAPIGVTPLLLTALPAWLLHRGTASAVAGGTWRVAGWVLGGYLGVAAPVTGYAAHGSVHVDVLSAALYVPVFAVAVTAAGTWAGSGRPPLARFVPWGEEAASALRAGAMGAGILVGGGVLLGGAALGWHAGAAGRAFGQLSASFAGQAAVLLLSVALVPNLAVWAASYALGPGFAVGAGSTVAPAGASGYPRLPGFPLLAALPGEGGGGALTWASLALPAVAGCAIGWMCGRSGRSAVATVRVAAGAACGCGLALGTLAAWSAGPLGLGTLATFGPTWWETAAAATAWPLALALPTSLALSTGWPRLSHHPRTTAQPERPPYPGRPRKSVQPARRPRLSGWPRVSVRSAGVGRVPGGVPEGVRPGWWRRVSVSSAEVGRVPGGVPEGARRAWWRRLLRGSRSVLLPAAGGRLVRRTLVALRLRRVTPAPVLPASSGEAVPPVPGGPGPVGSGVPLPSVVGSPSSAQPPPAPPLPRYDPELPPPPP